MGDIVPSGTANSESGEDFCSLHLDSFQVGLNAFQNILTNRYKISPAWVM